MNAKQIAESGEPRIVGVDREGNVHRDLAVLEENDVAYDPTQMTVDLTKAQKLRTTALMMAIQAYSNLIIKDAEYLIAVSRESHTNPEMKIRPATMNAMVEGAIQFECFIRGDFTPPQGEPIEDDSEDNELKDMPPVEQVAG